MLRVPAMVQRGLMAQKMHVLGAGKGARVGTRALSGSRPTLAATNFAFPAMSPTMLEGGIVEWKFKEGDSFSSGDVLLEIETDKAQIDVEAPDDGILVKIYDQAGTKGIPVGKTVAVVAEPGDDIASLELPTPEKGGVNFDAEPEEHVKTEAKQEVKPASSTTNTSNDSTSTSAGSSAISSTGTSSSTTVGGPADPKQTLLPSVLSLLEANGISKQDALNKIPASGPSGRLLKGDVLVYLGQASKESLDKLQQELSRVSKLDLSNIQLREAKSTEGSSESAKAASGSASSSAPVPPEPLVLKQVYTLADVSLLKSTLEGTFASSVPIKKLVEKASALALKDVPALTKPAKSVLIDPVFEELLAPRTKSKPFEAKLVFPEAAKSPFSSSSSLNSSQDIFSVLSSRKVVTVPKSAKVSTAELLNVNVTVNEKVPGAAKKAQVYLDRLGYYLGQGKGELIL